MVHALLLIPAFFMGYIACYVAMTYKVDQEDNQLESIIDEEIKKVSPKVKEKIIREHMMKTYYWTVGIFMFLIGFLLGTIASFGK